MAQEFFDNSQWSEMRKYDQLTAEKVAGKIFPGYKEGELNFPPSYKYDLGSLTFDTSDKQRVPSYCDRILWKIPDGPNPYQYINLLDYRCHTNVLASDHLPVSAVFQVQVGKLIRPLSPRGTQHQPAILLPQPPSNFVLRKVSLPPPVTSTPTVFALPSAPSSPAPVSPTPVSSSFPVTKPHTNHPSGSKIVTTRAACLQDQPESRDSEILRDPKSNPLSTAARRPRPPPFCNRP
eukprot:TRINITY_DN2124_c0_g1_i3.p1 TRINITY_DN2124_c0_g1~~TRINITY_DN2124_c0_g1_i3.p1  ORF type:complete len:235 (+),score=36.13 TRINITY_DN2124_c0_g1_i3:877-1581(+)